MRNHFYIRIIVVAILSGPAILPAIADPAVNRERKVKAAFLYNFMNFVDWPKDKIADANQPIVIGFIGAQVSLKALEPLKQKKIKGRKITINYFPDLKQLKKSDDLDEDIWNRKIEKLKVCHALLLCTCDSKPIHCSKQIIKALEGSSVLTVGETNGFLETGGMINFLVKEEKVRFEINNAAAKKAGLRISSKLLRLAERVVEDKKTNKTGDH